MAQTNPPGYMDKHRSMRYRHGSDASGGIASLIPATKLTDKSRDVPVAQLDRASASEAEGCRFETHREHSVMIRVYGCRSDA